MKMPAMNTNRYKVLEALYEHGPMSAPDLANKVPTMLRHEVTSTRASLENCGFLFRVGDLYQIGDFAKKYFDFCEPEDGRVEYVGEIVPAPSPIVQRPLRKAYMLGFSLNADRLDLDRKIVTIGNTGVRA